MKYAIGTSLLGLPFVCALLALVSPPVAFAIAVIGAVGLAILYLYVLSRKLDVYMRDNLKFLAVFRYLARKLDMPFIEEEIRVRRVIAGMMAFLTLLTVGLFAPVWVGVNVYRWNKFCSLLEQTYQYALT